MKRKLKITSTETFILKTNFTLFPFATKTFSPSLSVGVLHFGQGFVITFIVTLEASSHLASAALEGSTL